MSDSKTYTLVLDDIRAVLYGYFIALIATGYIITKTTTNVMDLHPSLLDWWWGTTNVCIVFDFPPSNYVLPSLYTIFILIFFVMSVLLFFRQKEAHLAGQISTGWYYFLNYLRITEVLGACFFLTIFAVSPDANEIINGNPRTLIVHTVPFAAFVVSMSTLTLSDFIYDVYTGFASVLGLKAGKDKKAPWYFYIIAIYPFLFGFFSIGFIILLLNPFFRPPTPMAPYYFSPELYNATIIERNVTDIHTLPCATNDWPNDPTCSGLISCANCANMLTFYAVLDHGWTFLVLFPPFLKSLFSAIWFRDRIFKVVIPVQPHYFEDHPFVIEADIVSDGNYVKL